MFNCTVLSLENIAAARTSVESLLICGRARFILYDSTAPTQGEMCTVTMILFRGTCLSLKNLSSIIQIISFRKTCAEASTQISFWAGRIITGRKYSKNIEKLFLFMYHCICDCLFISNAQLEKRADGAGTCVLFFILAVLIFCQGTHKYCFFCILL